MRGLPPTRSVSMTVMTRYLWYQSRIGLEYPSGVHMTGKHRSVFDSGAVCMRLPAMQSTPVFTAAMRHQFIGGEWSSVSTRLAICTPVNVTSGRLSVPPTLPVCAIEASHSPARVPSPGSGYECVSVHVSTSRYPLPPQTCVVTVDSRFCVQNVGEYLPGHDVVEVQSRSHGVSG